MTDDSEIECFKNLTYIDKLKKHIVHKYTCIYREK